MVIRQTLRYVKSGYASEPYIFPSISIANFVSGCFRSWLGSKVVKQFSHFRVRKTRDTPHKVLLPLSLGPSSLTLLHILNEQLRHQREKTSRQGYQLHIVYVNEARVTGSTRWSTLLDSVKARYPDYLYKIQQIEDIFQQSLQSDDSKALLKSLPQVPSDLAAPERLCTILANLPSPSSVEDIAGIIRAQVIINTAKDLSCDTICWADSTTRLAERALAETAKGRGFSLPWQTKEGISKHGLNIKYPLQDVLRREVVIYTKATDPPLAELVLEESNGSDFVTSSKNSTIDDLMKKYFASVEQTYPSIVANVVKTANRLEKPNSPSASDQCNICTLPIDHDMAGLQGWEGNQQTMPNDINKNAVLCYGCFRTVDGSKRLGQRD